MRTDKCVKLVRTLRNKPVLAACVRQYHEASTSYLDHRPWWEENDFEYALSVARELEVNPPNDPYMEGSGEQ